MIKWLIRLLSVLILIAAASIYLESPTQKSSTTEGDPETAQRKVLFLGNSFTSWWSVHKQVAELAASATPPVQYYVKAIAPGGYDITRHLEDGVIQSELRSGEWDVLVVQTSSITAFSARRSEKALEDFKTLSEIAKENGVSIVWYAHWRPNGQRIPDTEAHARISQFYNVASASGGGKVAEVGYAFDQADRMGIDGLLHDDLHHASPKGAYLAALEILKVLGDVDISTATYVHKGLSAEDAERLRKVITRRR